VFVLNMSMCLVKSLEKLRTANVIAAGDAQSDHAAGRRWRSRARAGLAPAGARPTCGSFKCKK
jgi:hypothetical protein